LYGARTMRDARSVSAGTKAVAVATATIGVPLIAADAGVRDKYALAAIAAVVGGVTGSSSEWVTLDPDAEIASAGGESMTLREFLLGTAGGGVPTWYNPFD
jgi:hypothetical protein